MQNSDSRIAVVIPAYRCEKQIRGVIETLPPFVDLIIVVEDCSPDNTAAVVQALMQEDPRIHLICHEVNTGVGGAVLDGYERAVALGADVIVKIDSDGQMDPSLMKTLIKPILQRHADYTKGNRFLHASQLKSMPPLRRLGNTGLSFLSKISSGCWNVFDPTNGYTAIHRVAAQLINRENIHRRYFFESSMLIELRLIRAVVRDVYMPARYGDETSSLSEFDSLFRFPPLLLKGFLRRLKIEYFIRDFTPVSLFLVAGIPMVIFGLIFGLYHWAQSIAQQVPATTGTVMVATLPVIIGIQLILQAFVMDIQNTPSIPLQTLEE